MLAALRRRLTYANVTATLALCLAVGGGSAWAINEWNGSNIQDESLTGADIQNGSLGSVDYGPGSVTSFRVADNSLTGTDVATGALGIRVLAFNSVNGNRVVNDSLTGDDIDESTLAGLARGRTVFIGNSVDADSGFHVPVLVAGLFQIGFTCHQFAADDMTFDNLTAEGMDVIMDDGSADPFFQDLSPGTFQNQNRWDLPDLPPIDVHTFQFRTASGAQAGTVWVTSRQRANDCWVQAHGLLNS
jgi:hypothetical protein